MFEPCGTGDNYRKAGNRMMERGQTRLVMNKTGQTGPAPERPRMQGGHGAKERPGERAV